MGIKGLPFLVKEYRDHFLHEKSLHDTKIVIDGNGLMYHLCETAFTRTEFGGDYYKYRSKLDSFFLHLKKCKIEPIVVLDGCKIPDDSKLQTSIGRHERKLKYCYNASKNLKRDSDNKTLLYLMSHEFKTSLVRNEVLHTTVCYEADDCIVKLANYFKCYILSDDSDFFVSKLKSGVIIMDSFDPTKQPENIAEGFVNAKVFHSERFKDFYPNLKPKLLALGGVLLGNDQIQLKYLGRYFLKNHPYDPPQEFSDDYIQPIHVFSYLDHINDYDKAVDEIKKCYPEKNDSFWKLLQRCVERYVNTEFPEGKRIEQDLSNLEDSLLIKTKFGKPIPDWMLARLQNSKLDPNILKILKTHRIFLPVQIENFDLKSSHHIALPIRQKIYDILSRFDVSRDYVVEEYDRIGSKQIVFERNRLKCPAEVDLGTINTLSIEERKMIFKKIVDIEFDEDLIDDELRGALYCIKFWHQQSKNNFSRNHIYALFFSILKYYYVAKKPKKYIKFGEKLEKYDTALDEFDPKIVHSIVEFQAIYLSFSWLNDLLDRPFSMIEPSRILSGTFFSTFYFALRADSHLTTKLLKVEPELKIVFKSFSSAIFGHKYK